MHLTRRPLIAIISGTILGSTHSTLLAAEEPKYLPAPQEFKYSTKYQAPPEAGWDAVFEQEQAEQEAAQQQAPAPVEQTTTAAPVVQPTYPAQAPSGQQPGYQNAPATNYQAQRYPPQAGYSRSYPRYQRSGSGNSPFGSGNPMGNWGGNGFSPFGGGSPWGGGFNSNDMPWNGNSMPWGGNSRR